MNSITIEPNLDKKSAKIIGTCAAGEKVKVVVKGGASIIANLRLRILCFDKIVTQFPMPESEDAWVTSGDDATCVLNLNTTQAEKFTKGMYSFDFLWIIDSVSTNRQLYAEKIYPILGWIKSPDNDIPIDLDEFPTMMEELRNDIEEYKNSSDAKIDAYKLEISNAISTYYQTITSDINDLKLDVIAKIDAYKDETDAELDAIDASVEAAMTKAENVETVANTANTNAETAISKANSAISIANRARTSILNQNDKINQLEESVSDYNNLLNSKADLVGGKIPASQLPGYVDDVLNFDSISDFPSVGEDGKLYVANDTNKAYRWGGASYVEIAGGVALGETSSTAYRGDRGKVAYEHSQKSGNPHGTSASDVGAYTKSEVDTKLATKLGTDGTAADSAKLGGSAASDYAKKTDLPDISGKLDKTGGDVDGTITANALAVKSEGNSKLVIYPEVIRYWWRTTEGSDCMEFTLPTRKSGTIALMTDLNAHIASSNPHGITCEKIGAAPIAALLPLAEDLVNHKSATNPHGITCEKIGAVPCVLNNELTVWHIELGGNEIFTLPWNSSQNKWVDEGPSVWVGDDGKYHCDFDGDDSFDGFSFSKTYEGDSLKIYTVPVYSNVAPDSEKLGGVDASNYALKSDIPSVAGIATQNWVKGQINASLGSVESALAEV